MLVNKTDRLRRLSDLLCGGLANVMTCFTYTHLYLKAIRLKKLSFSILRYGCVRVGDLFGQTVSTRLTLERLLENDIDCTSKTSNLN